MKILISFVCLFLIQTFCNIQLVQASAPFTKADFPAIRRIHLGAFEVIALSDGTLDLPMDQLLTKVTTLEFKKATEAARTPMPFETSVNTFLVNTGAALVLIDSGAGGLFGPTVGKTVANLKAAGYQPDQVDIVLITHLHPDHVGGLTLDGKIVFPNATIYADQKEIDHWLSDDNLKSAPNDSKSFFEGARKSLLPYQAAGRLKPSIDGKEITPGIQAKSTYGHTPGHTSYVVKNGSQKMIFIGDLIHVGPVQFAHPSAVIKFDTDSVAAAKMRKTVFTEIAKEGHLFAASHLSFPGIGYLRQAKRGYNFIPINFTR